MANGSGAVAGGDFQQNATYAAGRDIHMHASERPAARHALPRDIAGFIGRLPQILELEALLAPARAPSPVVIIANGPGCGKTALAVHVAHRLRERFPQAQLHIRLGGEGQPDLPPEDALRKLLGQLGVAPDDIPKDRDDMAALYRSTLPQGSLVVLDNAMSKEQVDPLLPAGPGCAAIVTSRNDLGVEGVRPMDLGPLPADEAYALLEELLGAERTAADQQATARIVELCGALPLALRIAGALLGSRAKRRLPLAEFADRLADEEQRLDLLRLGHTEVRASFGLSYRALSPAAARLFRLLGSLHVADVEYGFAYQLDGTADAGAALDELIDASLIEPVGESRVRFHDLMRLFAEERALEEEPAASRTEALGRACAWALDQVTMADRDELERERAVLVAVAEQATDDEVVWRLATGLADFFDDRGHWTDWLSVQERAVAAAIRLGDPLAHGVSLHHLSRVLRLLRRTPEALAGATDALTLLDTAGPAADRHRADALGHLGTLYRELHRYDDAIASLDAAADVYRRLRDVHGEGIVLQVLGHVRSKRRDLDDAEAALTRAAALLHETDDPTNEGWAHSNLISVYDAAGRTDEALRHFTRARDIFAAIKHRQGEAWAYNHAGRVHRARGDVAEQADCHDRALTAFRDLGDRYGTAWALLDLAVARRDAQAMREAYAMFEEINEHDGRGWALARRAELERDPAVLQRALEHFEVVGSRPGQEAVHRIGRELGWNR